MRLMDKLCGELPQISLGRRASRGSSPAGPTQFRHFWASRGKNLVQTSSNFSQKCPDKRQICPGICVSTTRSRQPVEQRGRSRPKQPRVRIYDQVFRCEDGDLDQVLWSVLRSTTDLLTSKDLQRVGVCADDRGCGWLFYDTSRNRTRQWCSMRGCGNRAKAKRHYEKVKSEE